MALDYMLDLFTFVMRGLQVHPTRMKHNLNGSGGLIFSQRLLLALIDKGLDRQHAYELVQRNAMQAWDTGAVFRDLLEGDSDVASRLPPEKLDELFDYGYYLRNVDAVFDRAGL